MIETKRLRLREYTWEDFDALSDILCDAETMKYYPAPYDEDGVRRWIRWSLDNYETFGFGLWAMERKDTGEFLGDCGLTLQIIDRKIRPEVGYHVRRDRWGQGFATEAARACRDWAFTHTPFGTLYSYMNAENAASRAVAEKNGMTFRKEYDDGDEHLAVYSVTREEWTKRSIF